MGKMKMEQWNKAELVGESHYEQEEAFTIRHCYTVAEFHGRHLVPLISSAHA